MKITTRFATMFAIFCFGSFATANAQQTQAPRSVQAPQHEMSPTGDLLPIGPVRNTPPRVVSSSVADTFATIDFAGGLADWTYIQTFPDTIVLWEYETVADLSATNADSRYQTFASPSANNGFLWLDYPVWVRANFTIGSPPYPQVTQSAISPFIDMTTIDANSKWALSFYSYQPTLNIRNSNVAIRQGGEGNPATVIWTTADVVDRPNTAGQGIEYARIPEQFLGQDSVQLLFNYDGDFYGWAVDDINIESLPAVSVFIDDNFYAAAPSYSTPITQLDSLVFVTDLTNNGGDDQEIKLAFTITDAANAVVASDTLDYGVVPSDGFIENTPLPRKIAMPDQIGLYTVTYQLVGPNLDQDIDPSDNSLSYNFEITENEFSKSSGYLGSTRAAGDPNQPLTLGSVYYIPNNADNVLIDSVGFGLGWEGIANNTIPGGVEVNILGWFGDLNGDGVVDSDEWEEISFREFEITTTNFPSDDGAYVVTPSEDGSVEFSSDYIGLIVQAKVIPSTDVANNGDDDLFLGVGPEIGYGAYSLASDSLGTARIATVIETSNGYSYGFFGTVSPYNPTWISLNTIGTKKEELPASTFVIAPNPASEYIQVNFDFGTTEEVAFLISDASGRAIRKYRQGEVQAGTVQFTTAGLPNGMYFVQAITASGKTGTKSVMVNH